MNGRTILGAGAGVVPRAAEAASANRSGAGRKRLIAGRLAEPGKPGHPWIASLPAATARHELGLSAPAPPRPASSGSARRPPPLGPARGDRRGVDLAHAGGDGCPVEALRPQPVPR